ncbi:MAG: PEP-CTERM sorting domain-containing protein [Pirellulales bacterium]
MSINFRRAAVRVLVAAGLTFALGSVVYAAPGAPSIGINFGANEPNAAGSAVTSAAGVLDTVTWNNVTGTNGSAPNLNADVAGASTATAASVNWTSAGTWASTGRGEENNTAPAGPDRNLMTGYLDTGTVGETGVSISVANLPPVPGFPFFDVYVYIKGGVNGRGGTYTIGGTTLEHTGNAAFNGTFLQDTIDPGTTAGSNYLVFRGLSGSGFTLTTTPTIVSGVARAPVNGIEIVASPIPEPGTIALLGIGTLIVSAGFAIRRRRSE